MCNASNLRRAAFTLFEVILSLALSVLVLMALGMAINIHLRVTDVGRVDVERAQLARALLRIMADDLHGAAWYTPSEAAVPSLPDESEENAGEGGGGGGGGQGGGRSAGGGGGGGGLPPGDSGGSSTSAGDGTTTESDDGLLPSAPGLYGDQYSLQLDVSRPPRPERFDPLAQQNAAPLTDDVVSEMRTVVYYLGALGMTAHGYTSGAGGTGLVRGERDRAVTQWSAEMGNTAWLDTSAAPLAEDVVGLQFRYFDGTEWVFEWDSDEREGLPVAVEIAVAVGVVENNTTVLSLFDQYQQAASAGQTYSVYRLLVHLPVAEPTSLDTSSSSTNTSSTPATGASP